MTLTIRKRYNDGNEDKFIELEELEIIKVRDQYLKDNWKQYFTFKEYLDIEINNRMCVDIVKSKLKSKRHKNTMECPNCHTLLYEGYRIGYKWYCGKCKKFKVTTGLVKLCPECHIIELKEWERPGYQWYCKECGYKEAGPKQVKIK